MSAYEREFKHNGYSQYVHVAGLGDGEDVWDTTVKANAVAPVQQASPFAIFGTITSAIKNIGKPASVPVGPGVPASSLVHAPDTGNSIINKMIPIALVAGGVGLFWWLKKGK